MQSQASTRRAEKSIRLFSNDAMEALTHVHPIIPLLFWAPVAAYLLWRSLAQGLPAETLAMIGVVGLLVWTLTEYALHRFVFHYPARSRVGKYLVFLFHGVHHDAPNDKTRLVMPPAGSVLIMFLLYQIFRLVLPASWIEPFCAFFIIGYLIYDYIHFAAHHFPMKSRLLHFLKIYHLQHHHGAPGLRYGVSSPLWDRVFGTYPAKARD